MLEIINPPFLGRLEACFEQLSKVRQSSEDAEEESAITDNQDEMGFVVSKEGHATLVVAVGPVKQLQKGLNSGAAKHWANPLTVVICLNIGSLERSVNTYL